MDEPSERDLLDIEREQLLAEMAAGRWGSILGGLASGSTPMAGRRVDEAMISDFSRRLDGAAAQMDVLTAEIKSAPPNVEGAEQRVRDLFQEALGLLWMSETMSMGRSNDLEPYTSVADWTEAHTLGDPTARLLCATKLLPEAQADPEFASTLASALEDLRAADPDGAEERIDRLRDEAMGAISQVIDRDPVSQEWSL